MCVAHAYRIKFWITEDISSWRRHNYFYNLSGNGIATPPNKLNSLKIICCQNSEKVIRNFLVGRILYLKAGKIFMHLGKFLSWGLRRLDLPWFYFVFITEYYPFHSKKALSELLIIYPDTVCLCPCAVPRRTRVKICTNSRLISISASRSSSLPSLRLLTFILWQTCKVERRNYTPDSAPSQTVEPRSNLCGNFAKDWLLQNFLLNHSFLDLFSLHRKSVYGHM